MRAVRLAGARQRLRSADPKYHVGESPLEMERRLDVIQPTNAQQVEQMSAMIERMYANATDAASKNALALWRMQLNQDLVNDQVKFEFLRRFYFWLLGRGTDDDAKKTMWGRANVAAHNDEVSAYIEQFARKRTEYALQLALMADRVPQTLNGYYLYYKYIVNGGLKRVKDRNGTDFWDLQQDDFLQDFDLLAKEFDRGQDGYSELMAPSNERPANKPAFGGPGADTVDPYPANAADREQYALKGVQAQDAVGERVAEMVEPEPRNNKYNRHPAEEASTNAHPPDAPVPHSAANPAVPAMEPVVNTASLEAALGPMFERLGVRMEQGFGGVMETMRGESAATRETMERHAREQSAGIERVMQHITELRANRPFSEVQREPERAADDSDAARERAEEEREWRAKQTEAMQQLMAVTRDVTEAAQRRHLELVETLERQAVRLAERAEIAQANEATVAQDRQRMLEMLREMLQRQKAGRGEIAQALRALPAGASAADIGAAMRDAVQEAFARGLGGMAQLLEHYESARHAQGEAQQQHLQNIAGYLENQSAEQAANLENRAIVMRGAEQAVQQARSEAEALRARLAQGEAEVAQVREAFRVLQQAHAEQMQMLGALHHENEGLREAETYERNRADIADAWRQAQEQQKAAEQELLAIEAPPSDKGKEEAESFPFEAPPVEIPSFGEAVPAEPPAMQEVEEETGVEAMEEEMQAIDDLFRRLQQNSDMSADEQLRVTRQFADRLAKMVVGTPLEGKVPKRTVNNIEKRTHKWIGELKRFQREMRSQLGATSGVASRTRKAEKQRTARRKQAMEAARYRQDEDLD